VSLSPGTRLGAYDIQSLLGVGGMGEVYCARDGTLGRLVALKTLPAGFTADADRLARFRREAQTLASLNHPHIAQIYGVDEAHGQPFLVLELVEGESLDRRIARGPVPLDASVAIARQIADALACAHDSGVVHRDLKPANIVVRNDGTVKVLDFGLAKVVETAVASFAGDNPTITSLAAVSAASTIVGTPAYMAPEQAQGLSVDKRADIWAFGVVMYEMVTGERPFTGSSAMQVLAGVVGREPDWQRVPARVRPALHRCLEKDPKRRLRDLGEFPFMLEEPGGEAVPRASRARRWPWVLATAVLTVAVALLAWRGSTSAARAEHGGTRLDVDLGADALATSELETALSADGRRLAFVVRSADGTHVATRSLDQPAATTLAGTENAAGPFFSPDGQWIGFSADGKLKKVPAQGGAVVTIANAIADFGASWADDGNIYFTAAFITPMMRVPANGGTPQPVMTQPGTQLFAKGDATHRWPQVLPGARAVLFTSHKIVTGFDDATIEAVALDSGARTTLVKGGYFGRFVPVSADAGYLLYVHDGVMFGVPFDPRALTVRGTAVPVLEDIAGDSDSGAGEFAIAADGTLIYRRGKGPARRWPILWMDSTGRTDPLIPDPGAYYTFRLSPDGSQLALTVDRGDLGREIEVYDSRRGTLLPLTHTGGVNLFPIWSPDGNYIVFESSSPRGYGLAVVRADGSGTMQRLVENDSLVIPYSFSPDGYLIYTTRGAWAARFDAGDRDHLKLGPPEPVAAGAGPTVSPDGRWIAYRSAESGRDQIYVRRFHGSGAKWQVSTAGEGYSGIVWDPHANRLYYVSPDRHIMAVDYVEEKDAFVAGIPREWAPVPVGATVFPRNFSISADGKRFAVLPARSAPPAGTVHVTFVMNFLDELRRKISPR
jgi:serine/threonine-protein kinase